MVVGAKRAVDNELPAWCIDLLVPLLWLASGLGSRLAGWLQAAVTGQTMQQRAIYGSLVAALLVSVIYARIVHVSWQRIGDTCAPPILLGVGFLRVGCFLAGCCWGDLCVDSSRVAGIHSESFRRQVQTLPALCPDDLPWRVEFPLGSEAYLQHRSAGLLPQNHPGSLPVHPVQLYEAVGTWMLCLSLLWFESRMRTPGTLIIPERMRICGRAVRRGVVSRRPTIAPWRADVESVRKHRVGCCELEHSTERASETQGFADRSRFQFDIATVS